MQITEIKPSQHKKGRFLVKLEDGNILRVTEEELLRFSLRAGLELDGQMLEALHASARKSAVRAEAANIIGGRPLSKRELTRRLVRKGADAEDAGAAADWLEDIGAVNDREYAALLVRHYAGKGYGRARIREEMRRRGVDRELWDEALEELPEAGGQIDAFLAGKLRDRTPDPREKKRLTDALLRRGFAWGDVRAAWLRRGQELPEA